MLVVLNLFLSLRSTVYARRDYKAEFSEQNDEIIKRPRFQSIKKLIIQIIVRQEINMKDARKMKEKLSAYKINMSRIPKGSRKLINTHVCRYKKTNAFPRNIFLLL
jgi:hypothetical protein